MYLILLENPGEFTKKLKIEGLLANALDPMLELILGEPLSERQTVLIKWVES